MRQLLRVSDSAEFVYRLDPEADITGQPSPDEAWLLAHGQPKAAQRFRVRPLSAAEFAGAMTDDEVCRACLLAVDGEAEPMARISAGMVGPVARLVVGVTLAPLAGLRSLSTAVASSGPSATAPSPASP